MFQYFNQILTAVLEVLDDSDSSIRELALTLIVEMLKNQVCLYISTTFFEWFKQKNSAVSIFFFFFLQKESMEESVEIVIEKLLHVTKDSIPKVNLLSWNFMCSPIAFLLHRMTFAFELRCPMNQNIA